MAAGGGRASLFLGFSCQPSEDKDYSIRPGTVKTPGGGPDSSHILSRARILPKGKRVSAPKIRAQSRVSVLATSVFK